ncbi:HAD family hydrolase [uncultured Jannaschia sp.]|uniref:HAD family hydrolase n=1 Tax=uncultured Jannaschia sp. TaxID=293347 RepID=UPI00261776FE|nr:HAD family hydrolase [uncultured Jannaschia sp.]
MIRAILFDKDGTFTDFRATWEGWVPDAVRRLARDTDVSPAAVADIFGVDLSADRILPQGRFVTASHDQTVALLEPLTGWSAHRLADWWDAEVETVQQVTVTDLPPYLGALRRRGLTLGVVTNAHRAEALHHLTDMGAMPHLARIVAADDGFGPKPAPDGARDFARALGLDAAEVALVGDGLTDMHAARGAGMIGVGVTTGTLDAAMLAPHADHVLPDITALPGWLDGRT